MGAAASAAPGAAPPAPSAQAARAKSDEKEKDGEKKEGGGPKTWKRAASTTHAVRVTIGDTEELPVRAMQMRVRIDGFRARVVLDTYFENERSGSYEGKFQLRLPDGATPYFFAFGETVWEKPAEEFKRDAWFSSEQQKKAGTTPQELMAARTATWRAPKEARVVPKEKAAFAFTETSRQQVDPALLEWAGAGVFNARLFPITAHRVHRVLLAYDVSLVRAGEDFEFRLDLPERVPGVVVDVAAWGRPEIEPQVSATADGPRTYLHLASPRDRPSSPSIRRSPRTRIASTSS